MTRFIIAVAKSRVKICLVTLREHSRIKLRLITWSFANSSSILIPDIAVKSVWSLWSVCHCYRNDRYLIKHIIQIVSTIRPYCHIRCVQAHSPIGVERILCFPVNNSFIMPVSKIIYWCRPAYIISKTKYMSVIHVM